MFRQSCAEPKKEERNDLFNFLLKAIVMQTGENEQALRKILDMTRLMAIILLILHFYYQLYAAFTLWQLRAELSDRILSNISRTGLFSNFYKAKLIALVLLFISLIGAKGRKDEKMSYKTAFAYLITGLLLYFASQLCLYIQAGTDTRAVLYMICTAIGFLLMVSGGTLLSRIIRDNLKHDIFNSENETFPQEERLLVNEFSINIPARYAYKGKLRPSHINIVIPQSATLIAGRPGAGKTAFIVRQFIAQALAKEDPYCLFVYDFKYPDLSQIAYNHWLKHNHRYKGKPGCYFINFDDLSRSHRCNVFDPIGMTDITDAIESARTILIGLNPEWERKKGDFFVESGINFVTAVIWFLRKYNGGEYCSLPHVIELMMVEYDKLFSILRQEPEVEVFIDDFIKAFRDGVVEQLAGQIASAKIAMARLSSPQLYYVLSGNDFTLDLNNPEHPKLICMGNNPQKIQVYGAVLSLYVNRMLKIVNQKKQGKCMLLFEEFPTLTTDIIPTIATGRSNGISTVMVVQDISQLRKDYGKEKADVIVSTVGNIISGQVTGDSAKQLSEQIGKIMQPRQSLSINSQDTSISKSFQLEAAVPASKIAKLSSGHFAGVVADTPDQPIDLKAFHCQVLADFKAIGAEEKAYQPIPAIRPITPQMVRQNYLQIKWEIQEMVDQEMEKLFNDPAKQHLIVKK